MEFLDARRLTGPSLLFDGPAAILDVGIAHTDVADFRTRWEAAVLRMAAEFDWPDPEFNHLVLTGGASFAFTAPVDALYAASMINEWAYAEVAARMGQGDVPDYAAGLEAARVAYADEVNPPLLELEVLAKEHNTTFLWDDDEVSLGLGKYSETWPVDAVPDPGSMDWPRFRDVPLGIVTGTNGKTTTVRLAQHILIDAGRTVGLSSTDWIAVNHDVIDRGDWSGPGGARTVLRQPGVDVAVLEAARGGLLRRGLGVQKADAALITKISEDHLGDFGSHTVDELLDVKWVISRAVRDSGRLILNADDPRLCAKAADYPGAIVWFSIERQTLDGLPGNSEALFCLAGHDMALEANGATTSIVDVRDVPLTMQGIARHNVANALAAAALTWCLGAELAEIGAGLKSMSQDDNPGRCNLYDLGGRKVLIDFAHNPAAMQALFAMAEAIPAERRVLCFGQAGDRPDDLIEELTRDAYAMGLDRVIVSELAKYHRGRETGEVFGVIRTELERLGMARDAVEHNDEEMDTLQSALEWARPGDLVIMLALGGSAPIAGRLTQLGAKSLS